MDSKICTCCGESKYTECFNSKSSVCKVCFNWARQLDRKFNPEKYREIDARKYQKNKETVITRSLRWRQAHPDKCKEIQKEYDKRNKDTKRNTELKRQYGITLREYRELLARQGDGCAICGRHKDTVKISMHVDHDHKTGKIRGILCSNCNRGLGHMQDSEAILSGAINYLRSNI